MQQNQTSSLKVNVIIGAISSIIIGFLIWLIYFKTPVTSTETWVSHLPATNALLNSLCFGFLIAGFGFIKWGEKLAHIICMLLATASSALFVTSYIVYHYFQGDTKFLAEGPIRVIYFFILISHIILSIPLVPLVLLTLWHAFKRNLISHKRFARITFPIWVYVSITGVLIFVILHNFNL
jgi:putative membrane protein